MAQGAISPAASVGKWTRELIPPEPMGRWLSWSRDEVSFRFTQLWMDHGSLDCYLHQINRVSSPVCPHCGEPSSGLEEDTHRCSARRSRVDREAFVHWIGICAHAISFAARWTFRRSGVWSWTSLRRLSGSRRMLIACVTAGQGAPHRASVVERGCLRWLLLDFVNFCSFNVSRPACLATELVWRSCPRPGRTTEQNV